MSRMIESRRARMGAHPSYRLAQNGPLASSNRPPHPSGTSAFAVVSADWRCCVVLYVVALWDEDVRSRSTREPSAHVTAIRDGASAPVLVRLRVQALLEHLTPSFAAATRCLPAAASSRTVTERVVVAVAPSSSVTVRRTW